MKKMQSITAAAAMLSLVLFSSTQASADGFAPGEGLYVGAFVGGGMGIVQPKVTSLGTENGSTSDAGGVFEATDGGLGLAGIEGGGMFGYGYKMGDLYAGLEGEMAGGDIKFKLTSSTDVVLNGESVAGTGTNTIKAVEATKDWTGGLFGRLGYYVNPDTLISFKGGVLVSKFDVSTTGSTNYSEEFYAGGPSFGLSMESRIAAIDPNLSVRVGGVYTDFLTASVFGLGTSTRSNRTYTEITGSAMSARLGLQYSFFDINSLF
jgi:hypothetical protein